MCVFNIGAYIYSFFTFLPQMLLPGFNERAEQICLFYLVVDLNRLPGGSFTCFIEAGE